jgi:hypothetical protein
MIIFYVDDFLVARPNTSLMGEFFHHFQGQYVVKRMGFPEKFVGIQIEYFPELNSAILHQQQYILGLARKYLITDRKVPASPMSKNFDEHEPRENETYDFDYAALVGALLFATVCVRLDICHATGILTRATQNPQVVHFREATRVLAYLKGTAGYGIVLGGASGGVPRTLSVYVDADWAGDPESRRSTAGHMHIF